MFGIGKAGSDAYDAAQASKKAGTFKAGDALLAYRTPEPEKNAGHRYSEADAVNNGIVVGDYDYLNR